MTEAFKPVDEPGLVDCVREALAAETSLEVVGQGSKRAMGRPSQAGQLLDMSACSGIVAYEPEELVLTARAGTPVADIEALLAENGQELVFEPIDYSTLLGGEPGSGTLGGVLAANLSGPRRIRAGAARDSVLGISGVTGRGEAFKSGGRVVKNVTGYDLSRGLAGSWGTLAVLSELTFKVLPAARAVETLVFAGLDDARATALLSKAMGSTADVSGAAHLPAAASGGLKIDGIDGAATLIRLEGIAVSVAARSAHLADLLSEFGAPKKFDDAASRALWRAVRDCRPFAQGDPRVVWRLSVAPTTGPAVASALAGLPGAGHYFDWAGGLIWFAVEAGEDAHAETIRAAVAKAGGGHATLVRAAPSIRARVPVFEPQAPALAALSNRLKENFDPRGILNPGRMVAGV